MRVCLSRALIGAPSRSHWPPLAVAISVVPLTAQARGGSRKGREGRGGAVSRCAFFLLPQRCRLHGLQTAAAAAAAAGFMFLFFEQQEQEEQEQLRKEQQWQKSSKKRGKKRRKKREAARRATTKHKTTTRAQPECRL